jgi:hypothetical protein
MDETLPDLFCRRRQISDYSLSPAMPHGYGMKLTLGCDDGTIIEISLLISLLFQIGKRQHQIAVSVPISCNRGYHRLNQAVLL